jgi:hypothetical protein
VQAAFRFRERRKPHQQYFGVIRVFFRPQYPCKHDQLKFTHPVNLAEYVQFIGTEPLLRPIHIARFDSIARFQRADKIIPMRLLNGFEPAFTFLQNNEGARHVTLASLCTGNAGHCRNQHARAVGGLCGFEGIQEQGQRFIRPVLLVKILSGRTPYGKQLSSVEKKEFNPRGKEFHNFSDSEFFLRDNGTRDYNAVADAFNNRNIFIIVEDPFDDDTIISREKFPDSIRKYIKGKGIKNSIVIYSVSEDGNTVLSNCIEQYF